MMSSFAPTPIMASKFFIWPSIYVLQETATFIHGKHWHIMTNTIV